MRGTVVEGISLAKLVQFCTSSMELRIHENSIFVLPVNILTGVAPASWAASMSHYTTGHSQIHLLALKISNPLSKNPICLHNLEIKMHTGEVFL